MAAIIEKNPIGKGLDVFRASFDSICEKRSISCSPDALDQLAREDVQYLAFNVLSALQMLPATRLLRSETGRDTLRSDLLTLIAAITSDDFDFDRIKPLLNAALANKPDDEIWDQAYNAVTTPPPSPIASFLQQTLWLRNTSSFANSSEHRKYVDNVLKEELGSMYIGLHDFYEAIFEDVAGLETASEAVFNKCMEGNNPLFDQGWSGWPENANQDDVLGWFAELSQKLAAFAEDYESESTYQRRILAKPTEPIDGSIGKRKMEIGFVDDAEAGKKSRSHWAKILIPGELKSNPSADKASEAWLDLGRYASKVLAAQDTRRFVLGFTICGSLMRVWQFDRLGGIASEQFDINEDGLRFVSTILAFLSMNEEQLGFDPTIIISSRGERYIEIERDDEIERLIIDKLIKREPCIAGRATTCWKAHSAREPLTPLVIKDSWQYTESEVEGELLLAAAYRGVVNVAKYYHHETVQVLGTDDDVRNNVRKGLDITTAANYRPGRSMTSPSTSAAGAQKGRSSSSTTGSKRSSSQTGAPLPPSKRSCSVSPTKVDSNTLPNRVHRRVILRNYGKPIYKASSRAALLAAIEGCIEGHESLYYSGFLHRDISINNLMMNEEDGRMLSSSSFLIDLDLAIKRQREGASGVKGKTGTRAFMAIGVLLGEQHSFMHDLESFFWVLFWVCIHYTGPGQDIGPTEFDNWNYESDNKLVGSKKGVICDEEDFLKIAEENFTPYYQPLIPCVNRLRRCVFPNGERWRKEDPGLYLEMQEVLLAAQETEESETEESETEESGP